ncbi:hypothetical protein [Priestia aryabhattai]|uniref:hypothetical protein n=1 Tax=Priestia aryabhattai TaxID=412384 RepID=UPI001ADA43CF|nr:hypothetical protein [Priestia aryabhattai]QTL49973.1 hypothetical protein J5Z55_02325 [Priestia aryabhattai]
MLLLNAVQNNEELIKELQKQVEKSNELVKDMEQKVISLQDHQISFLNDSISNFWTVTSVAIAVVAIIITGVSLFIGYLNRKAQKKMEDAEKVIGEAKFYIAEFSKEKAELENSRKETEGKIKELTDLIKSEDIDQLKEDTKILFVKQKITSIFESINRTVINTNKKLEILQKMEEDSSVLIELEERLLNYDTELFFLKTEANSIIANSVQAEDILSRCLNLEQECDENFHKIMSMYLRKKYPGKEKPEGFIS